MDKDDEDKPLTPEEATKKIREAARKGNIVFAETDRVEAHNGFVEAVIKNAFGIDVLFLSDDSNIGDFAADEADLIRFFELYGFKPTYGDKIVDLCDRIMAGT